VWIAVLAATIVSLAGVLLGFWWAPFPVAIALGFVLRAGREAVPAGAATGLLAWLVPLGVANFRSGLGPTATALAAIMGFKSQPEIPLILTLLVGALLGLTGAWLGSAARGAVAPNVRVDATGDG